MYVYIYIYIYVGPGRAAAPGGERVRLLEGDAAGELHELHEAWEPPRVWMKNGILILFKQLLGLPPPPTSTDSRPSQPIAGFKAGPSTP